MLGQHPSQTSAIAASTLHREAPAARNVLTGEIQQRPVAGRVGGHGDLSEQPADGVTAAAVISSVKVPVTLVMTVIQSRLPNWIG
jgi:hypothetical protein